MWRNVLMILQRTGMVRKLSIALGMLAIIVLIWLVGPSIGLNTFLSRSILIIVLACAYILFRFMMHWRAHRQGKQLANEILAQGDPRRQLDVTQLKQKLQSAISTLKTSELSLNYRSSAALYTLPWYMLIGPSGTGKTTLLRNSGLKFPLASDEDLHVTGFGGTRNCDWWFANEALILDTAGRYTTENNDHAEWVAFLNLLKQHRRKLPVNGILIALSLSDILMTADNQLQQHASIVRERISELNDTLGYILPINIIFTKCDLLKGFREYFANYTAEQQQQVWGVNLQDLSAEKNINEAVQEKLQDLYERVRNLGLQQLEMTANANDKILAINFPAQLHVALQKIQEFIKLVTQNNPYQAKCNLRGIYLTSGHQEGMLIEHATDKFIQANQTQGLPSNKSYFISRLLKDVIIADRHSAIMTPRTRLLNSGFKLGALSMAAALVVCTLMFWILAFAYNRHLLNDSVADVAHLRTVMSSAQANQWELLDAQLAVFTQYDRLANHSIDISFDHRMGLYAGDRHELALRKILGASLQHDFLRPVAARYEVILQNYRDTWANSSEQRRQQLYIPYYQALKEYLMLGFQAQDITEQEVAEISALWQKSIGVSKDEDTINPAELDRLVAFYLHNPYTGANADSLTSVWLPNKDLVTQVRTQLRHSVDIDLIYDKLNAAIQNKLSPVTAKDILPGSAAHLFVNTNTLAGMYTKKGWDEVVYPQLHQLAIDASAGDWVLNQRIELTNSSEFKPTIDGGKINAQVAIQLEQSLVAHYFQAYLAAWYQWLSTLEIKPATDLAEASDNLAKLAKADGPMTQLLQTIADNLALHDPENHWQLFGIDSQPPIIYHAFNGVSDFINRHVTEKSNKSLDAYLDALQQAQSDTAALSESPNQQVATQKYAIAILSDGGGSSKLYQARLKIDALLQSETDPTTRKVMMQLLSAPLRNAWLAMLSTAAQGIQAQWQSQVLSAYQNGIAGKVPFVAEGDDSDLNQVKQFFAPQSGIYWQFVNQKLVPFVTLANNHWQLNSWLGVGMPLSAAFMQNLQQAQDISGTLFGSGTDTAQLNFALYPIPSPKINMLGIVINNNKFLYENGPQEWHSYEWNSAQTNQHAQLLVVKNDGESEATVNTTGEWSLFKLLRKASAVSKQGTHYVVSWDVQGTDGHTITAKVGFRTEGNGDAIGAFTGAPFNPPEKILP
jgi:type VI secretion system protein ImpL